MNWTPNDAGDSEKKAASSKEWKLIEKLVSQLGVEQRRSRRWGIFFKLLTFLYLFALLVVMTQGIDGSKLSQPLSTSSDAEKSDA